jgi:hypothetical protein
VVSSHPDTHVDSGVSQHAFRTTERIKASARQLALNLKIQFWL